MTLNIITLSITTLRIMTQQNGANAVMLSVANQPFMVNVIMLSVVMLNVVVPVTDVSLYHGPNKLKCLSPSVTANLFLYLQARLKPNVPCLLMNYTLRVGS
jgi:hypothetical protein